jgi:NAD(P)-dependent dehydrogenase (short-subunit alcohol dehydrogenase family)
MTDRTLEGRVAVVTGAGGGIGAGIARALGRAGAAVVVNDFGVSLDGGDRSGSQAPTVVDDIVAAGSKAVLDAGDVGDHRQAGELVDRAVTEFGRLDILVNAAGIVRDRMIFNLGEDDWDAVIRVHLKGTYNTTHHASRWWRDHRSEGEFRLLNLISGAGLFGAPGQPSYAAAKMGIVGLTQSCANALQRYGVSCVSVSPGASTRMTSAVPADRAAQVGIRSDDEMAPENVAPGVVYLAGPDSSWLNGCTVGFRGYRLQLYSGFELAREIVTTQPWTPAAAGAAMEATFKPALERTSMFAEQSR